jgi:8-oxo-dGTP diphosphatase
MKRPSTERALQATGRVPARRAPPSTQPAAGALRLPLTTVDVVVFAAVDDTLQVLLGRRPEVAGEPFPGLWALPGGFVDPDLDADLAACAARKLREKTGIGAPYLEQLGSWGNATRDPRGWSATHVYFALVRAREADAGAAVHPVQTGWFDVGAALRKPRLAFDHATILAAALERLRSKAEYTSLPAFLLPEPFTLPQLQRMYEIVLDRPVDKSGFRTRMLAARFLQEAGYVEGESNRPAMGYRLRERRAPALFPRTFSPRGHGEPETS